VEKDARFRRRYRIACFYTLVAVFLGSLTLLLVNVGERGQTLGAIGLVISMAQLARSMPTG
jgi:hypothetical protein